ncbi:MAG: flagellar basal-body MS-ring/collar protein FliF [Verrucomicrobiota bacterium]
MGNILQQFKDLWSPLGANQKISLILAGGLVALAMIAMMLWAAQPDYQLMYRGLSAEDAGEIVNKLEQKGVAHELRSGGSIYVEGNLVHKLRAELAADGLVPSGGSGKGFELFDTSALGVSDFHQRTNYKRAIEGELGRTISQFRGIRSARVMVVMPENRLIVTPGFESKATASVFVDAGGGLANTTVTAIRQLVANAVPGLAVNSVAVADSNGTVYGGQGEDGIAGFTSDAMKLRQKYEKDFSLKVQTMLDQVLGPYNSVVRVAVDIDTTAIETKERVFEPEGVVRSKTVEETSNSEQDFTGGAGGLAGAAGNIPNSAQGAGAGASKVLSDSQETLREDYEIGQKEITSVQNPGTISRVTAAVTLNKLFSGEGANRQPVERTEPQLEEIREMVVNSLGIKLLQGEALRNVVTITEYEFAPNPMVTNHEILVKEQNLDRWIEVGLNSIGAILGIGVIIFFLQMLKRNKPEQISVEVLQPEQMLQSRKMEDTSAVTPEMLNELIRQKPANIGVTLKDWIGDPEASK